MSAAAAKARPREPRMITLAPTFTNPRENKKTAPPDITGLFYGKTLGWWFVHVDGETRVLPRADWCEVTDDRR